VDNTIVSLFHINPRFLRSTHLERDFSDPDSCTGYIPTDFTVSCLERLAEGLVANSTRRAWRLTGDYGTGKSSFALVLAHLFSGHQNGSLEKLQKSINIEEICFDNLGLAPILVTGNRLPLGTALQSALRKSLATNGTNVSNTTLPPRLQNLVKTLDRNIPPYGNLRSNRDELPGIEDEEIVEDLVQFSEFIKSEAKGSGVLLILDELGKFLEFAAMYPERQDIYLLQQLAEAASRSGDTPLFVLGLLHQGFSAYADHLDGASKQEWEKVAGRFEEILFNQPLEQVVPLLSSALGIQMKDVPVEHREQARTQMEYAFEQGWYGPVLLRDGLLDSAAKLFPLDPLAVPIIVRTMHRFGQNERSLFSFLQSSEPFGLQAYASQHSLENVQPYRIHDFYDYVRTNLSRSLNLTSVQTYWSIVDSVISSYASGDSLEIEVLKTVGMLNLLNANDLLPTEMVIVQAVAGTRKDLYRPVRHAIDTLKNEKRVLYDRGIAGGLCLWPHTSVDLDVAYKNAERAVGSIQGVSEQITEYLDPRPIVARRHYIQTGNLRHFKIQYLSASEFAQSIPPLGEGVDGKIIIVLCDSLQERQKALQVAKSINHPQVIIAIPAPLHNVTGYLRDFLCWDWLGKNTLELNTDPYASEEVARQREATRNRLEKRIGDLIDLRDYSGEMRFNWFSEGEQLSFSTGQQLLKHLSDVCDRIFPKSPKIQNELINRQNLSSAASGARMRLIGAMFEKESQENLGMQGHKRLPEVSMYLSILKPGNIHVEGEKMWYIQEPSPDADRYDILPTLKRIDELLKSEVNKKVTVSEVFAELRKPPYGIRDGLIPFLLAVYIIAHRQDVAVFEDGTFLREVRGDDFLRLTKAPEYFEIQHSEIEGIRASVFDRLVTVLGIQKKSDERNTRILDVVQPLCTFVVELPEYVHNTKKLSQEAIAIRNKLMSAGEPAPLLFRDLPSACGHSQFDVTESIDDSRVESFAEELKLHLTELNQAYTELLERLKTAMFEAFDAIDSNSQGRSSLAKRAEALRVSVNESQLKALCGRLSDQKLPETKWIESVASFIASKPPSYWGDSDETAFQHKLTDFAERFKHVESIHFEAIDIPEGSEKMRLSITRTDGNERVEVVYLRPDAEKEFADIQKQIQNLLTEHGRLGLAAVARAVWDELNKDSEETG
jgi:hypothetical protein